MSIERATVGAAKCEIPTKMDGLLGQVDNLDNLVNELLKRLTPYSTNNSIGRDDPLPDDDVHTEFGVEIIGISNKIVRISDRLRDVLSDLQL